MLWGLAPLFPCTNMAHVRIAGGKAVASGRWTAQPSRQALRPRRGRGLLWNGRPSSQGPYCLACDVRGIGFRTACGPGDAEIRYRADGDSSEMSGEFLYRGRGERRGHCSLLEAEVLASTRSCLMSNRGWWRWRWDRSWMGSDVFSDDLEG